MDDDTKLSELLESQIGPVPDTGITYPDVTVKLVGEDGNAFNLIGLVATALQNAGRHTAATEFTTAAFEQGSYDELLTFIQRTVNVE